jgi:NADH:ubiquinone oxidoreductase subunit K
MLSAIFLCFEYGLLGVFYRRTHVILFISFWIKLCFFIVELALLAAFGAFSRDHSRRDVRAVLEWSKPTLDSRRFG